MANLVERLQALRGDLSRLDEGGAVWFQESGSGKVVCPHVKGGDRSAAVRLTLLYERFGLLLPEVLPITCPTYREQVLANEQPFNRAVSFMLFGPRCFGVGWTDEGTGCISQPVAMLAQAIDGLLVQLCEGLPTSMTVAQVAKVLKCSEDTVRRRANAEGWQHHTPKGRKRGMVFDVEKLPPEISSLLRGNQQAK